MLPDGGMYLVGKVNFMIQADATRPSLLVRMKNHHDRQAWEQFVELYAPVIHEMASRRGLQDSDAADVTQEVLRAVSGAVARLDYDPGKGTFRGWLFTVTRNALNRFFEAQKRVPPGSGDSAVQQWLAEQPARDEESAAWDQEYRRRLLAYAAEQVRTTFEDATWKAFWQTAVEGKSGKVVAASLDMTVGAVYIAKSRVISRIKEQVRELMDE
jgi:RNA polymerase sigma-70 factor (ECF subfamily)